MAIQLPNGKITRTLPEQVGFITAKVEEIIKAINDFELVDKVINIDSSSGTLTDEQYEIAELSPSYVLYGGKVFVKAYEDGTNIDFFRVGPEVSGSSEFTASAERIRVVSATKAFSYSFINLFTSYNKTQLDLMFSEKASLSGAAFIGDVSARTLKQDQANWSYEITNFPNITGGVSSPIFCRIQQINQELHIVMLGKIVNNSGAAIAAYSTDAIDLYLPTEIANKIYDVLGHKVSEAITDITRITYNYASCSTSDRSDMSRYQADVCMNILNYNQANRIGILFQRPTQINIPDGATLFLEARVSLDLI